LLTKRLVARRRTRAGALGPARRHL